MLIEIDKSIKKLLQNEIEKYKEGNKKALSVILNLIKRDIAKLLNENELTIKLTKTIIEDTFEISIKDDTFYKWVRRNIKKSNIKEVEKVKVTQPAPVSIPKQTKQKEVKNEKSEVKEKKKANPVKILNDNSITATDNKYKDLL